VKVRDLEIEFLVNPYSLYYSKTKGIRHSEIMLSMIGEQLSTGEVVLAVLLVGVALAFFYQGYWLRQREKEMHQKINAMDNDLISIKQLLEVSQRQNVEKDKAIAVSQRQNMEKDKAIAVSQRQNMEKDKAIAQLIANAKIVNSLANLKSCSLQHLLDEIFPALDTVSAPQVDLTEVLEKIRRTSGRRNYPKTDLYAAMPFAEDVPEDMGSPAPSQRSSVPNAFSQFRRGVVHGGPNEFSVHRWIPDDRDLEAVVVKKIFNNDLASFQSWLDHAIALRGNALRLLSYKDYDVSNILEIAYQWLFTVIFASLLRMLPGSKFQVLPVNKLALKVVLAVAGSPSGYVETELKGYADVGVFFVRDTPSVQSILVAGEFKRYLRSMTANQPKDQMLIEMMAVRANSTGRSFGKGFLTDIFALNIAVQDQNNAFYVAPRICDHRVFWVRLLFLLCDLSAKEFKQLVLYRVEDIDILREEENDESDEDASGGSFRSVNQTGGESRVLRSGAVKSGAMKAGMELNFKDWELEEEFEELFTEQYIQANHLYGREYLCQETLNAL
jgi:hypothetical protein